MPSDLPVLIIGAGIVGLTLAQSLRKASIPFIIFERDLSSCSHTEGWGLTIHWALSAFQECLPHDMVEQLQDIQVDREVGRNDTGRFLFLDLKTGKPKFAIPPSKRLRIHRGKLRTMLQQDVDVRWGKTFRSFEQREGSIVACFEDGTSIEGALLVGADGSSSRVRRQLFALDPEAGMLHQLPVRFMGVTVRLMPTQASIMRDIDPLLFQGSHPDTGVYLWYSTLSTPETNGSRGNAEEYYEGQLMLSWMYKSANDEVPPTDSERVKKLKAMAEGFEPRLLRAVQDIPPDARVLEIKLQDWPPRPYNSVNGHVIIIGDAAHAMTMYRGEAFNHGITDAATLSKNLSEVYMEKIDQKKLIEKVWEYQEETRKRCYEAVLLSRRACLDAHDIENLGADSPLVSKRARILVPGKSMA